MSLRSILRVVVAVSLAVFGLLLLLELSARVFLFGLAGLHPRKIDSLGLLRATGLTRTSPHPELGLELEPDLDGYFKLARFRTNSRGLRDREYTLEKLPDTYRVAVLGASFTMPSGVEIEDSFHSILEERLTAESPALTYEFINFAVAGYGPRQCLAMLRLRALDYAPDLLVFAVSKLSMPRLLGAWDRPLPRPKSQDRKHSFFASFLVRLLEVRLGGRWVGTWQARVPHRVRGGATIIEKLSEISRATGIAVVVMRLEYDARPPSELDLDVETGVRSKGLHFLDTRRAFAGTTPSDFWIHEIDPHPNGRAHAIFAETLATFLLERHLTGH